MNELSALEKILTEMKDGETSKVLKFEKPEQHDDLRSIGAQNKHQFVPEILGAAWIPRRATKNNYYKRSFKGLNFIVQTGLHDDGSEVGLPSGLIPRKVLARLTTMAIANKSPEVDVRSVAFLLGQTNLTYNGQMVKRIREQLMRLAFANVSIRFEANSNGFKKKKVYFGRMFSELELEIQDNQLSLFPNKIKFADEFFREILRDEFLGYYADELMEMSSPLQHDIYLWLIRRTGRLTDMFRISWENLHPQFANSPSHAMRDFRRRFKEAMKAVTDVSGLKVDYDRKGIILHPPKTRKFYWVK